MGIRSGEGFCSPLALVSCGTSKSFLVSGTADGLAPTSRTPGDNCLQGLSSYLAHGNLGGPQKAGVAFSVALPSHRKLEEGMNPQSHVACCRGNPEGIPG